MMKNINNNNILMISHIEDIDGMDIVIDGGLEKLKKDGKIIIIDYNYQFDFIIEYTEE